MVTPEVVGHIDPVGLSSLKTNGKPGNRRAGLVGGADRDPAHPAVSDVVADLEAEGVAVEGQGRVRVVVREDARVNGDVHGGHSRCGSVTGASRFLTGLVTCFATHDAIPAVYFFRLGQKNDPEGTCREPDVAADDLEAQVEDL